MAEYHCVREHYSVVIPTVPPSLPDNILLKRIRRNCKVSAHDNAEFTVEQNHFILRYCRSEREGAMRRNNDNRYQM
jgi:hypothetical protein